MGRSTMPCVCAGDMPAMPSDHSLGATSSQLSSPSPPVQDGGPGTGIATTPLSGALVTQAALPKPHAEGPQLIALETV